MNARKIGLWFAAGVGVTAIGLIAWSVLQSARSHAGRPDQSVSIGPTPDLIAAAPPKQSANIESIVQDATEGHIVGIDKNDPKRVAYELFYKTLEPQGPGRVRVTKPRAWIHQPNGGLVHVQADAMTYVQPAGSKEPESGRLTGHVTIRVIEPDAAARLAADKTASAVGELPPGAGAPSVSLASESLNFDSSIGELSTVDSVRIESAAGLDMRFTGLRLVVDEPRKRISFLRTESEGTLRYSPRAAAASNTEAGPGVKREKASKQVARGGAEDLYRAEFSGDVLLTAGGRVVEADTLEMWARVIGGSLAPGAIAGIDRGDAAGASGDPAAPGAPASRAKAAAASDVTLTWSGPLIVRPLESEPPELRPDQLTSRFTSRIRGVVQLRDLASGVSARCVGLDYRFTSGIVTLTGPGAAGVTLTAPGNAEAVCGRLDIDLKSGLVTAPGPGLLRSIAHAEAHDPAAPDVPPREITWQERGQLVLATKDSFIDTSAHPLLREAMFQGAVVARDARNTITGDFIRTRFTEGAAGKLSLQRVIVDGHARADAGANGKLSADHIDAEFIETPVASTSASDSSPATTPSVITAQGKVKGQREGATIAGELLEARLARGADGQIRVESFNAEQGVLITSKGDVEITGDSLRVTSPENAPRIVELTGEPVMLRRAAGSVTGASMRFDESTGKLTVFGACVFNHSQPRNGALGYERVQVQCTKSMTYDDSTGVAEFVGDCIATAQPNEFARDVASGARIVLELTPRAAAASNATRPATPTPATPEAHLRRAIIFGTDSEPPENARIESRRYVSDAASETGLRLERIVYLEGPKVVADAEKDTLEVPGAGKLLFEDRRPETEPQAKNDSRNLRGTTLFEWQGSLLVDRRSGHSTMANRVRMRKRGSGASSTPIELECERLDAETTPVLAGPNESTEIRPEIIRAEATDAVYVTLAKRQLITDRLIYDGMKNIAECLAAPGNLVTLYDETQAGPLTGAVLRWNLGLDRIEWLGAGETTMPR